MGALQRGPGGPWPSQNFGWVGHNAFGPTNNWPICSLILHCGQLILRKIGKIGATRYQILRLKCTKFTFCWGSAPDPAGGAYSAPDPCLYLRGLLLRGWRETGEGEENCFELLLLQDSRLIYLSGHITQHNFECPMLYGTLVVTLWTCYGAL